MTPNPLDAFVRRLRPLLDARGAQAAWIFGSHARGTAAVESDVDVMVVAPTDRPVVERFRDYLPAIANVEVGVDFLVYTPEEFEAFGGSQAGAAVDAAERFVRLAERLRQTSL